MLQNYIDKLLYVCHKLVGTDDTPNSNFEDEAAIKWAVFSYVVIRISICQTYRTNILIERKIYSGLFHLASKYNLGV